MPADSTILASLNNKWFNSRTVVDFKNPFTSSSEPHIVNRWFHLEKLETDFSLYKVLQVIDKSELKKIPNASISAVNFGRYSVALQGAVLSYNPRMEAYDLKVVDYDDLSEYNFQYDYENVSLEGIMFENSLRKEKSGFVGYSKSIGNEVPKCFGNVDFMRLYKRIYCKQTKVE